VKGLSKQAQPDHSFDSLTERVQAWADKHYQAYYLDLTKGPVIEPVAFVRSKEVPPLTESQRKLQDPPPKNWKTAWPKKWGWCLPRGAKPPEFLRWEDAAAYWQHQLKEHSRQKLLRKEHAQLTERLSKMDVLESMKMLPEFFRFRPVRFELPRTEIPTIWVDRVNQYFLRKMSKHKLLKRKRCVEISCFDVLEEGAFYLKVCRVHYTNSETEYGNTTQ